MCSRFTLPTIIKVLRKNESVSQYYSSIHRASFPVLPTPVSRIERLKFSTGSKNYQTKSASQAPLTPSSPVVPNTPIAFISGHLQVDQEYFNTHYLPRIRDAVDRGHLFTMGPARGIDTLAFEYLGKSGVPASRIQVYLSTSQENRVRGRFKRFEEVGGAVVIVKGHDTERDAAMTRASDYDILRYRTEEEARAFYGALYRTRISGTEKNESRRKAGCGLVWPGL